MVRQRRNTVNSVLEYPSEDERDGPPATPRRSRSVFGMHSPRNLRGTKVIGALLAFIGILWLLTPRGQATFRSPRKSPADGARTGQFHFLLPASSANKNLCRLLLSSIILNYPVPVLINYGTEETKDPYDMHLLKIQKMLDYLRAFPAEKQDDLVLFTDAYDVWLQLPPEVLIRRYYDAMKQDDAQLEARFGRENMTAWGFKNTIYFSNDKACWPDIEGGRPACWAGSAGTLPRYAYGPIEDDTFDQAMKWGNPYQLRARWLNSGAVMGPIGDVLRMLEAVAVQLKEHYEFNSDQFYVANVWGYQEYVRLTKTPNWTHPENKKKPDLEKYMGGPENCEFHMTLDYESSLFQSVAFFDPYLSFLKYDGSINSGRPKDAPIPYADWIELEDDVKESRPPLEALGMPKQLPGQPRTRMKTWAELPLLSNLVSKHTSPIIHFLIEKEYRIKWWDRMWYTPFARDLLEASRNSANIPIMRKAINGTLWTVADRPVVKTDDNPNGKDGAWTDKGAWLTWDTMCAEHEGYVFTGDRRDAYSQG